MKKVPSMGGKMKSGKSHGMGKKTTGFGSRLGKMKGKSGMIQGPNCK